MTTPSRDLLLLTGKTTMNPQELEHQVELLNALLYHVECFNAFCTANEIIDLNKYKIFSSSYIMLHALRQKTLKPFVFICNKN
jgi:hypothetical protein